jgi:formate-dependent nitrite reductase membrane component NrfD
MNKRDTVEVGLKLLGVYCFLAAIAAIPVSALYITTQIKGSESVQTLHLILSSLQPIFFLCLGIILLYSGNSFADRLTNSSASSLQASESAMSVAVWIRLIGLYLAATSVGGLLHNVALTRISRGQTLYDFLRISSDAITIFIGLYFIFKGDKVALFIQPTKRQTI